VQGIPASLDTRDQLFLSGARTPNKWRMTAARLAAAARSHASFRRHGERELILAMEFIFDPERTLLGTVSTPAGEEDLALSVCIGAGD